MSQARSDRYREAGVDIDAGDELVRRISPLAESTRVPGATEGLGGFGGVFDLHAAGFPAPGVQLVSGTDGVGTKLMIAFATGIHDTIGIDCVAMCVNDILAVGARPLFFLDYFATGKLEPEVGQQVVAGIAEGCKQAKCWLMGGETAEMPGMYADGEYDLAGFVVGGVTDETRIEPAHARAGDVLIGVASSGLHSNGFSLARHVLLNEQKLPLDQPLGNDTLTLGERLLVPTQIYVDAVQSLRDAGVAPHGIAHITGGGMWENPQRALTKNLGVTLDIDAMRAMRQPIFQEISARGNVSESEMYRVFNMGIGLVIIVDPKDVDTTLEQFSQGPLAAKVIGKVQECGDGPRVQIPNISNQPIS